MHKLGEVATDCQPQPGPSFEVAVVSFQPSEALEDAGVTILGYTNSRVANPDSKRDTLGRFAQDVGSQDHIALRGELDRVTGEVHEHLADANGVSSELDRQVGG